ncbi:MAG: hypothetical protein J3R72DRAFT_496470 [Linnemannia gamsii]|nr:MAG: hypothetical protein J3R72DRAFT_496470 [Linnemannia gamsii]
MTPILECQDTTPSQNHMVAVQKRLPPVRASTTHNLATNLVAITPHSSVFIDNQDISNALNNFGNQDTQNQGIKEGQTGRMDRPVENF